MGDLVKTQLAQRSVGTDDITREEAFEVLRSMSGRNMEMVALVWGLGVQGLGFRGLGFRIYCCERARAAPSSVAAVTAVSGVIEADRT